MNRWLATVRRFLAFSSIQKVLMLLAGLAAFASGIPGAVGMANEVSTTTISNDEATEWISDQVLRTALYNMALYQFAEKYTIPKGEGRTFQIPRYEQLVLPQNPLTQGTTPSNTAMTVNKVTAVAEQWGAVVTIYDVPILSTAHNLVQQAISLLGVQAGQVYEREIQRVVMAGTNTQFANSKANRGALTTADTLNSGEIRKAVANLGHNGAARWRRTPSNTTKGYIDKQLSQGGGNAIAMSWNENANYNGYIGVVDESVAQDLMADATFVNASSYQNIRALHMGEIGMWLRVNWIECNFMPAITLLTSPTIAGANMTGFAGGLSASTTYDMVVTRVREAYGIEELVSATISTNTDVGNDCLAVTLPSSAGNQFRLYIGTSGGTMYEVQTASSAVTVTADDVVGPTFDDNQTVRVTAVPTSGRTAPVAPASGVTAHVTIIFGLGAYGCAELAALESFITPRQPSDSDPLNQRRKIGWKGMFKGVIQNNNFLRIVESASAYDV